MAVDRKWRAGTARACPSVLDSALSTSAQSGVMLEDFWMWNKVGSEMEIATLPLLSDSQLQAPLSGKTNDCGTKNERAEKIVLSHS